MQHVQCTNYVPLLFHFSTSPMLDFCCTVYRLEVCSLQILYHSCAIPMLNMYHSYAKYKLYSAQILYLHCTIVPSLYHFHAYGIQICAKIFISLLKILFYKHTSEITVIVCLGFSPNYQIIMSGPSQGVSDAPHVII